MTRNSDGNRNGRDAQQLGAEHDSATRRDCPTPPSISTPDVPREAVERVAAIIHDAMRWAADNSCTDKHPEWQGGTSLAEDEARRAAHKITTLPASEGAGREDRSALNVAATRVEFGSLMRKHGPVLPLDLRDAWAAHIAAVSTSPALPQADAVEALEKIAKHLDGFWSVDGQHDYPDHHVLLAGFGTAMPAITVGDFRALTRLRTTGEPK
jgi:hypothetical protein